jgi:signal peptidase I
MGGLDLITQIGLEGPSLNRKRRPWVAALATLVQPGLGHLYAGTPARAGAAVLISFAALPLWGVCLLLFTPRPDLALVVSLLILSITIWLALDAARSAKRQPAEYMLRPYNRWHIYAAWVLMVGALLGYFPRNMTRKYLVQAFRVPSGSMEPSLLIGDLIFVSRWRPTKNVRHGSMVVFNSVEEPGLKVIKRVVGMPGDTIAMRGGNLHRNGVAVTEPYAVHREPTRHEDPLQRSKMRDWQISHLVGDPLISSYAPDLQDWGPVVVPPDSLLLLGDNRDRSYDSRYYGFVPLHAVVGKPTFVYYSYDPSSKRRWPWALAARWDRVGIPASE